MDSLSEKAYALLQKIPKSYFLPIGIALAGTIFLGIGLIQLFSPAKKDSVASDTASVQKYATPSANTFATIQIDVEGAVVRPGVYSLPQNARVQDGLIAAGGLSGNADREVVAKGLNLAAKVTDGVKIYVPHIGEAIQNNADQGVVLGAQAGLVNINTATSDQLDALPGIGPVTAQKIIAARPFSTVQDLLTKKAVTKSTFAKIKDLVTAE